MYVKSRYNMYEEKGIEEKRREEKVSETRKKKKAEVQFRLIQMIYVQRNFVFKN